LRRFNNLFIVDGYLAAKPTSRGLPSGTLVANAHLAESAADKQAPNWFPLSFYDGLARRAIEYDKGDHLMIKGQIEQRKFTPEGKGQRERTVWELKVDQVYLVAKKTADPVAAHPVAPPDGDAWPVGVDQ
jgi:single-stranded DNA-binding protein